MERTLILHHISGNFGPVLQYYRKILVNMSMCRVQSNLTKTISEGTDQQWSHWTSGLISVYHIAQMHHLNDDDTYIAKYGPCFNGNLYKHSN